MQAERAKYEAMWQHDDYRKGAPGERVWQQAITDLGMRPGETVIDFGCGTGRPAQRLQDWGLRVTAVDFATNCLDRHVDVPFREACLWDLPDNLMASWGFCTDVMEHIPPERVTDTLDAIRKATTAGVFFQIATRPDAMGRLIGKPLHLTVRDADWWRNKLRAYWTEVNVRARQGALTAVCR